MRFSADWFKKLFAFASKREKSSVIDEADSSHEKVVDEAEAEDTAEKPSFGKRLMRLFRREKTSLPDESEEQDEPQPEPDGKVRPRKEAAATIANTGRDGEEEVETPPKPGILARLMNVFGRKKTAPPEESEGAAQDGSQAEPEMNARSAKVAAPVEETRNESGDVEALPKPGFFARLGRIFRWKKKAAEAEETGEESAGQDETEKGDESASTGEPPKRSLWARLSAVFRRKSSEQSAADLADAAELFSWGEGQAPAALGEKAANEKKGKVGEKGKKEEKSDPKIAEKGESIEGEEAEAPPPGFRARVGKLIRNKKVWIPLLLLIIGMVALAVSLTLYQLRTREHARLLALEKKNKQLQEENKKLQAPKRRAALQPSRVPAAPTQNNRARGSGGSAGHDSSDDCTVKNKATAAEVLKRCIDDFNAAN